MSRPARRPALLFVPRRFARPAAAAPRRNSSRVSRPPGEGDDAPDALDHRGRRRRSHLLQQGRLDRRPRRRRRLRMQLGAAAAASPPGGARGGGLRPRRGGRADGRAGRREHAAAGRSTRRAALRRAGAGRRRRAGGAHHAPLRRRPSRLGELAVRRDHRRVAERRAALGPAADDYHAVGQPADHRGRRGAHDPVPRPAFLDRRRVGGAACTAPSSRTLGAHDSSETDYLSLGGSASAVVRRSCTA